MRQPDKLVAVCLAAFLGGLLLLKGGVHPRHASVFLMGIAVLGSFEIMRNGLRWSGKKLWLPALLVAGVTLQLLPIPSGIRAGLAPGSQIVFEAVERDATAEELERYWEKNTLHSFAVELGESPSELLLIDEKAGNYRGTARPLSLDPGKTRWSLVVWLTGGICLLLGIRLGRSKNSDWFLWCSFGLVAFEAVVGLWGVRADSLLLFDKQAYLSSATGTLVNRNHFGTLMLLGLGVAGTLLIRRERSEAGPLLLITQLGAAACLGALLASQSRAAMTLGGAGIALGLFVLVRQQRALHKGLFYSGLVLLLGFFAWRTGYFERFDAVGQTDRSLLGRLDIWAHAIEQWRGAMIGGVGLGAFSWAASLHQLEPYVFHFAHAHSDVLQLFTEGGVLVGGVLFAAIVSGLVRMSSAWWTHEERLNLLPLMLGLTASFFHGWVDFPFQIPAILLLWLALAGWLWGRTVAAPIGGMSVRSAGFCAAFVVLAGAWQAGVRDGLEHHSQALLAATDLESDQRSGEIEAHLRKEKRGARRGLGRLALEWAQSGNDALTQNARLIRFQNAAAAAQRRAQDQPLDANAYVSESLAWALASQTARERLESAGGNPENFAFRSEWAMHKALILQPTNPLVYEMAAEGQLILARSSPLARGHQRRSALLLNRALELDPWVAPRVFRSAGNLPIEDLEIALTGHPRVLYEASREWQRRGLRKEALELVSQALELPDVPKEAGYQRAELVHALYGIEKAQEAYRSFLDSNGGSTTMRGWAFLRIGENDSAIRTFERALKSNPANQWAREGLAAAGVNAP